MTLPPPSPDTDSNQIDDGVTTLGRPSLVVFGDEWGRHPSSCQHLIGELMSRYDVNWVNTIGMRQIKFDLYTLRRGFEKLRHWTRVTPERRPLPPGLRVHNPLMWPKFSGPGRRLNRMLLERRLGRILAALPEPPAVVTTLPTVADLIGRVPARRWVYYCIDDLTQWPNLDAAVVRAMERELIAKADEVVVVSEVLREKFAKMGRRTRLLTHGVHLDFWRKPAGAEPIPGLRELPRPLVVYWGLIDRRMDTGFVRRLAADMTSGSILLVGPQNAPDPDLARVGRVTLAPALPFAQLPALARAADVLVMPYADLPVTRALQPLKLKEYLATGKPVVVRDLPATRDWADCLDTAATPADFSRLVRLRLTEGVPDHQRQARSRLTGEDWAEKARMLEGWITGEGESDA